MDIDTFLGRYPEFEDPGGDTTLVEACLEETATRIDASVFGSRYDEAHGALTAHELWSSAFGVSLRADGGGDGSKYLEHFNSIKKAVATPLTMMVI